MSHKRKKDTRVVLQSDWKKFIKYLKETFPELSKYHDNLLPHLFYSRRVNMNYIIPEKGELEDDPLVKEEGLYPSSIIPERDGRMLVIRIKEKIRQRDLDGPSRVDEYIFGKDLFISEETGEEAYAFIQNSVSRYIVSRKSRNYYSKNEWYNNTESSLERLYPTLIFPKEFVGDIIGLINLNI